MRTTFTCLIIAVLMSACPGALASDAVFQYSVPVEVAKGEHRAFLWIPPQAAQVRGIAMGGMTLIEREFAKDPIIREACGEQQVAIVFLTCGLGAVDVQKVLDDLAKTSGYQEIAVAPLFYLGHSAGGPQAKVLARKMADRCFGLMQFRGGVPGGGDAVPAGIPTLAMVGQFDEFGGLMRDAEGREGPWERARDDIAGYRAADEANLASIAVEPGAGHFAWSKRNAEYLAMFIRKAAAARIPATWPIDATQPVKLKDIDPKSGWLTNLTIRSAGEHPPAAYGDYTGDKSNAAWHFDKEMAEATVAFHKGFGRKDQFIKWEDRYWVDAGTRFFFLSPKWVGDGQTIEVHPVYADKYPGQYNGNGPRWLQAGEPVGNSGEPIRLKVVSGPMVPAGPNMLRVKFDALSPADSSGRMTFMAYSEGNEEYRHTEIVGMMPRGFKGLNKGKDQTITFPEVGNLKADAAPVPLKASSDADVPVEYYVAWGPAKVEDGKLVITDIPARATYPIEVKVVAWQFGRGVEPLVKTASPVSQTLHIEKP